MMVVFRDVSEEYDVPLAKTSPEVLSNTGVTRVESAVGCQEQFPVDTAIQVDKPDSFRHFRFMPCSTGDFECWPPPRKSPAAERRAHRIEVAA